MITTTVISLAGLIVLVAAAASGYRKMCQRRVARALAITTPRGITESGYVRIGGIDQWIQIRGEDRANPVLLFLHGSGMTMTPFTPIYRDWEQHYTVVQWDRRGTGRTLRANPGGSDQLTHDLMAADGIEVAEYLREHLGTSKIVLLGHSQGSIVGILMAQRRPDLFHAYVGTGQVTDMARNEAENYPLAVQRAHAAGHRKATRELAKIGPGPYPAARTWLIKQRWSFSTDPELRAFGKQQTRMLLTAPDMTLRDIYRFNLAFTFFPQPLYDELMHWDSRQGGTRFAIPFFLLHGDTDPHTLTHLAAEYFAGIEAPVKDLALLPGSGHCAVLAQPGAFLAELRTRLDPITAAQACTRTSEHLSCRRSAQGRGPRRPSRDRTDRHRLGRGSQRPPERCHRVQGHPVRGHPRHLQPPRRREEHGRYLEL